LKSKSTPDRDDNQSAITSFLSSSSRQKFHSTHPRQTAISDAIVRDLIIGCLLPLNLVENRHFRDFLQMLEPKL